MFKKAIAGLDGTDSGGTAPALAAVLADEVVCADSSLAIALRDVGLREGADLIVTPTDVEVTDLLHDAPCPIALAAGAPRDGALRRIIVGFDGSEEAADALRVAEGIAREHGARLSLLTVAHPVESPVRGLSREARAPSAAEARRAEAEAQLDRAVAGSSVAADGEVVEGDPVDELAGASRDADLVVVGSRGYGRARRVVAGSTARGLLHHAGCAVLVVPRGSTSVLDDAAADEKAPA